MCLAFKADTLDLVLERASMEKRHDAHCSNIAGMCKFKPAEKNPGFQVKTCMHVWNGVKAVQIHLCSHTTLHVDAEDLYNTGTLLFPFKYKASKLGKKVHQ